METDEQKTEEVKADAIVKAEPADLAKLEEKEISQASDDEQTFLMATNPYMMGKAQKGLIAWTEKKIASLKLEAKDHQGNLDIAKKRKIRTEAYQRYLTKTNKKIEFYEKVKAALEAGYCVIPDMDMEIFAVRTVRKAPKRNLSATKSEAEGYQYQPSVPDQNSSHSALGEGKNVSVRPYTRERTQNYTDAKTNKAMVLRQRWASEFDEEIDFPFKLAKPAILNHTTTAMAMKVFDELGVLPRTRQADPVVVGRITYKEGYNRKSFNFLIAWFLDTKDL